VNYQVTGANLQTFVNNSSGNITGGNIISTGAVAATGNVSGNYILGNGSLLTGIPAQYGNANVAAYLPTFSGNLAGGNATITNSVSAATFSGSGAALTNLPGANVVGAVATATTATTATSATTATTATTAGTVTTAAQANITSVGTLTSLATSGNITALGNVSANYFVGNGSALTGIVATTTYNDANVAAFLPTYTGAMTAMTGNVTTTGNVQAAFVKGNGSALTGIVNSIQAGTGISISGATGVVTISATGGSTTISSGSNYANTAFGSGKFVINGGNSNANVSVINGLGSNTLALFNSAGNCYIELTESGNIWLNPGGTGSLSQFIYMQDNCVAESIIFSSSRGVAGTNTLSDQGIDFKDAAFQTTMKVPVYTVASKPIIGRQLGQIIAISDSPTNNGRLAYYCSNNNRWQYVDTNGAV
jgi:hypothetical protein